MVPVDIDGQKAAYLKMPTPELQQELREALQCSLKKRLKNGGFERVCATRRDHPFHSDLVRQRIDHLADKLSGDHRAYSTDTRAEVTRQDLLGLIEDTKNHVVPITEDDIDYVVDKGRKDAMRAWARAIGQCREYLRDPKWHKGTYLERTLNPPDQPPLPDNPLPKPVYVSKRRPDLVIQLQDEFVKLYTKVAA